MGRILAGLAVISVHLSMPPVPFYWEGLIIDRRCHGVPGARLRALHPLRPQKAA